MSNNTLLPNAQHPHSLLWFSENRPEIYNYAQTKFKTAIDNGKQIILTTADVKAGKREITEACKLLFPSHNAYYFTSLDRKDVKSQQTELQKYGIDTFITSKEADINAAIESITEKLEEGKKIIAFYDECDYGSGSKQKMARLFNAFLENKNVIYNLISATAEETLFSTLSNRPDFIHLQFIPPKEYCGAKYFLDNKLVHTPKPFFEINTKKEIVYTTHAINECQARFNDVQKIGGTRLIGKGITTTLIASHKERLETELSTLLGKKIAITVIDQQHPFKWDDKITQTGHIKSDSYHLLIFNQTCTRGTDLKGWHSSLAFWHDSRHCSSCNLNTLLQAILRPSHYSNCYKDEFDNPTPQKIHLYVDIAAVMAATGDYTEYRKQKGKAPTRTKRLRNNGEDVKYEIHGVEENITNYDDLKPHFDKINQSFPDIVDMSNENKFYSSPMAIGITREDRERRIWDFDSVSKKLKQQFNRKQQYVIIPCYTDITNSETLRWIIVRKLSKQKTQKGEFITTSKSVYNK